MPDKKRERTEKTCIHGDKGTDPARSAKFTPFYIPELGKTKRPGAAAAADSDKDLLEVKVPFRKETECLFDAYSFVNQYRDHLDNHRKELRRYYDNAVPADELQKVQETVTSADAAASLAEINELALDHITKCAKLERAVVLSTLEVEFCKYVLVELALVRKTTLLYVYEICKNFNVEIGTSMTQFLKKNNISPKMEVPYATGVIVNTSTPYSVKCNTKVYFKIKLLSQCAAQIKTDKLSIHTNIKGLNLSSLLMLKNETLLFSCYFSKGSRTTPVQQKFAVEYSPVFKGSAQSQDVKYSSDVDNPDWVVIHTNSNQTTDTEMAAILARMGFIPQGGRKDETVPFPIVINKTLEYMAFKLGHEFFFPSPRTKQVGPPSTFASVASGADENIDDDDDDDDDGNNGSEDESSIRAVSCPHSPAVQDEIEAAQALLSVKQSTLDNFSEGSDSSTDAFNADFLTPYEIGVVHKRYFGGKADARRGDTEKFLGTIIAAVSLINGNPSIARLWEGGYIMIFMEKDVASALARKHDASVIRFSLSQNDALTVATPDGNHYIVPFKSRKNPDDVIKESMEIGKILRVRTKKFGTLKTGEDTLNTLDSRDFFLAVDKKELFPSRPSTLCDVGKYIGYEILN